MMTKESQYLFIKQKLDSYNISTTFPMEVMPLLHSLISRIEQESNKSKPLSNSLSININPSFSQHSHSLPHIEPALRRQIQRTLSSNNNLHMQLITQKQQTQALKHCIDKMALSTTGSSQRDEVRQVIHMCREKENQLVEELQVVKFKYNELVDFIMGEDKLQKMYIKKLLNHRKYENMGGSIQQTQNQTDSKNHKKSTQDLNSRITFKPGSSREQSRHRINKTIDSKEYSRPDTYTNNVMKASSRTDSSDKLHLLEFKLANREKEIQRLQTVIRHDGPSFTKVLTQFNHELQQQQYRQFQQRIDLLQKQNHEIMQQLEKSKSNGGRYQALIEQVDKSHALIAELKKENATLKRQQREKEFDLIKETQHWSRNVMAAEAIKDQFKVVKCSDQAMIEELKKKVQFYERELGLRESDGTDIKGKNFTGSKTKTNSKKQGKTMKTQISKPKDLQQDKQILIKPPQSKTNKLSKDQSAKKPEERQRYQDQIGVSLNKGKEEDMRPVRKQVNKQNKKLPISQIIEEEDDDESYVKPERHNVRQDNSVRGQAGNESQNWFCDQQNDAKEDEAGTHGQCKDEIERIGQPAEKDSGNMNQGLSSEQRNETMIQQYEETINQLSAKCLQLREELASKNQTIEGLQEIAHRLINKHPPQSPATNPHSESSQLAHQVQTLSSLLNESEFQKEELRRELIRSENKEGRRIGHQFSGGANSEQEIAELKKILEMKDVKISDMREDNTTIQDQLLKALDRIRRLNDEIDALRSEKDTLKQESEEVMLQNNAVMEQNDALKQQHQKMLHDLSFNQVRFEQAALLLKQQRERNSSTLELSEMQKDEIITLRKALAQSTAQSGELEQQLDALREQNQRLLHQLK